MIASRSVLRSLVLVTGLTVPLIHAGCERPPTLEIPVPWSPQPIRIKPDPNDRQPALPPQYGQEPCHTENVQLPGGGYISICFFCGPAGDPIYVNVGCQRDNFVPCYPIKPVTIHPDRQPSDPLWGSAVDTTNTALRDGEPGAFHVEAKIIEPTDTQIITDVLLNGPNTFDLGALHLKVHATIPVTYVTDSDFQFGSEITTGNGEIVNPGKKFSAAEGLYIKGTATNVLQDALALGVSAVRMYGPNNATYQANIGVTVQLGGQLLSLPIYVVRDQNDNVIASGLLGLN